MPPNPTAAADAPPGSESDIASRIERIPFCSWHIKTRLTIGVATFFEGFNILSISYVLPVLVPRWHLTPPQTGALIGVGFLGGAISTFALGWIAERFGRKTAIVLSTAAYSVASLLCALAWNFASMFVLRGLQGNIERLVWLPVQIAAQVILGVIKTIVADIVHLAVLRLQLHVGRFIDTIHGGDIRR